VDTNRGIKNRNVVALHFAHANKQSGKRNLPVTTPARAGNKKGCH